MLLNRHDRVQTRFPPPGLDQKSFLKARKSLLNQAPWESTFCETN
jgi:hypothetical protein